MFALALLAALTGALARAMLRATGGHLVYPLDDTYIQMAIAKTLAAHGTWGVTRFEFSGAGSSLLWPPLLAAIDRLTGLGASVPLLVNLAAAGLVVVVAELILRRHIVGATARAAALALVVVATPLPALALVGMEHTLQCAAVLALALAGVRLCAAPQADGRRLAAGAALLGLVAMAIRYDAGSIVVVLALLMAGTRGWRPAVALMTASVLPTAAYAAMAWRHGWPPLPAPILIKQRLWGADLLSWHGAADALGGGALTVLVGTPALLVLVIAAAALVVTARREQADRARESEMGLLLFLGATAVHVQFGRVGWLYRYEAYLVVLGVVTVASAIAHRRTAVQPSGAARWAAAAMLAAALSSPLLLRAFLASREVVDSAADLYRHEYVWSHFFQQVPAGRRPAGRRRRRDLVLHRGSDRRRRRPGHARAAAGALDRPDRRRAGGAGRAHPRRACLIISGPGLAATAWPCVAAWTTADDTTPNATLWLFAADDEAGSHLARDLRIFSRAHGGFSLAFAGADRRCPGL